MANIGNPFTPSEKKAVLCGSGELGKEVAIELERYGVNVVAVDKYPGAPAMQVAQSSHVLSMLDGDALAQVIEEEKPDLIIPEVEAIATPKLIERPAYFQIRVCLHGGGIRSRGRKDRLPLCRQAGDEFFRTWPERHP